MHLRVNLFFFFTQVTCQDYIKKIIMLITPTALNRIFDKNLKLRKPSLCRNITYIVRKIQEHTRYGDT